MAGIDAGAPSGAPAPGRWAGYDDEEVSALVFALTMAQLVLGRPDPVFETTVDLLAELEVELRTRPPIPPEPGTGGRPFPARVVECHVDPLLGERLAARLGPVGPTAAAGPTGPPTMTEAGPEGTGPRPLGPGEHTPAPGRDLQPLDGLFAALAIRRGVDFERAPLVFMHMLDGAANDLAGLAFAPALSWEQTARALAGCLLELFEEAHAGIELATRRAIDRAAWCNRDTSGLIPGLDDPAMPGSELEAGEHNARLELLPDPVTIDAPADSYGLSVFVNVPRPGKKTTYRYLRHAARVVVYGADPDRLPGGSSPDPLHDPGEHGC